MNNAERLAIELMDYDICSDNTVDKAAALLRTLQAENEVLRVYMMDAFRITSKQREEVEFLRDTNRVAQTAVVDKCAEIYMLKQENEALRVDGDIIINRLSAENNRLHMEAQQEPVAWFQHKLITPEGTREAMVYCDEEMATGTPLYTTPPNHTAVLRQALEALDDERYVSKYSHIKDAITAIREQLGETP